MMMSKVFVVGVGMTPFGKLLDSTVKSLTQSAVQQALDDAGATAARLEAAFYANTTQGALEGQLMIGGQIALRAMGIQNIPITNVENACASGASAFHLAHAYIKAGLADVVLAIGVDKMYGLDKAKSASIFNGGWDVHAVDTIKETLNAISAGFKAPQDTGGNS